MKFVYEAIVTPVSGGLYEARFPALGIITQGSDMADVAFMAQDLLENHIVSSLQKGRELPSPSFGGDVREGECRLVVAVSCDVDTPQEDTMSVAHAADVLDVSETRVRAMIRDGILSSRKVGRVHLVDAASVMRRFNEPVHAGRPRKKAVVGELL